MLLNIVACVKQFVPMGKKNHPRLAPDNRMSHSLRTAQLEQTTRHGSKECLAARSTESPTQRSYSACDSSGGVPSIIVAEPDGTFVNKNDMSALEDARHMTPQGIADWLAQWAK